MKRLSLIISAVLIALSLSGCFDYREIKKLTQVAGIGIDYENQQYIVTAEIASMKSGGEEIRDGAMPEIISAQGKSPASAFEILSAKVGGELFLQGCSLCILGNSIAQKSTRDITYFMLTNSQIPQTMQILISRKSSADIFKAKPQTEQMLSTELLSMLSDNEHTGATAISCNPIELYKNDSVLTTKVERSGKRVQLSGIYLLKDGAILKSASRRLTPYLLIAHGTTKRALLKINNNADFLVTSVIKSGKENNIDLILSGSILPKSEKEFFNKTEVEKALCRKIKSAYNRIYSKELNINLTVNLKAQNLMNKG